ncbi:MAG: zf-HC2 domain-containing protein [Bryobacterales bacterium]|nr:zf-HC2 domain-containing protein [Bryobacterales bacterium]
MRCHFEWSCSDYIDGTMAESARVAFSGHLAHCRECAGHAEELIGVGVALRSLRVPSTPASLGAELQVLASREHARHMRYLTWTSLFAEWGRAVRLATDNLMRPLALPFAGGLISTLGLFAMLLPTLGSYVPMSERILTEPRGVLGFLNTEAAVADFAPFGISQDFEVEVSIDQNGTVVDYSVADGGLSREAMAHIGNMLLFTTFSPATAFGQPTLGKVRISFRRGQNNVVVKG